MATTGEIAAEIEEYLQEQADQAEPFDLRPFTEDAIKEAFPNVDERRIDKAMDLLRHNEDVKISNVYARIYLPNDTAGDQRRKWSVPA